MPSLEQAHHAEGALKRVLKIVVMGIDRLVIAVLAGKTSLGPPETPGDELPVGMGKHCQESCRGHRLYCFRIFCHDRRIHSGASVGVFPRRCDTFVKFWHRMLTTRLAGSFDW